VQSESIFLSTDSNSFAFIVRIALWSSIWKKSSSLWSSVLVHVENYEVYGPSPRTLVPRVCDSGRTLPEAATLLCSTTF
jgi:hypothetical protein